MRYKIKSPEGQYERILGLLRAREVNILLKNDRRHLIAAENVSDAVRGELVELGASVAEDVQYAPE